MSFEDVKGQEFAVDYLKKVILKRRIPPTLMFVGKSGIGRRKTAITFAKALNCKRSKADSCDKCDSCIAIENGVHPNVKIIGETGRIGIDEIRNLSNGSFSPIAGGYKVNIIENADNSSIQAFNSMLKYLEEPPENTVNILIVNNIFNIPETIRSRSVQVKFFPLSRRIIADFLTSKGVESEKAVFVSHFLNGSLQDWEKYVDDDFLKSRKLFMEELLLFFQGQGDVASLLEKWKNVFPEFSAAESAKNFFDWVAVLVEDILHVFTIGERNNISNIDFLGYIADKFSFINKDSLVKIFDIMKEQKNALLTNANPRYIMIDGILRMKEVIV